MIKAVLIFVALYCLNAAATLLANTLALRLFDRDDEIHQQPYIGASLARPWMWIGYVNAYVKGFVSGFRKRHR